MLFVIILAIGGGYYAYKAFTSKATPTQYVTAAVEKGTLTVSVSGTGQVSSSNQVEVKPLASGKIIRVNIKAGQEVKANTILVQIDAADAQKTVRDAQVNLESAKLSLEKLNQPTDAYSLLQAENAVTNAQDSLEKLKLTQQTDYQQAQDTKQKAADDIVKAYEDSFNAVANAFLDLPTIINKLNDILYSYEISKAESSVTANSANANALVNTTDKDYVAKLQIFADTALADYAKARQKYDQNFIDYKNSSRYSDKAVIESLLAETLDTTKMIAQAGKSQSNLMDAWVDYRTLAKQATFSKVTSYQTNLSTYTGQTNSHLSTLLASQRTLQDDKEAVTSAERDLTAMAQNQPLDLAAAKQSVKEKEASLAKLKAGTDSLDIRSQELTIRQRQNSLADAREKLADYTIRAPLDGIIAELSVKAGDQASSGTAVATMVTKQKVAEVSLNEVDVAKVKVGQKTTLTFDAVEGLNITGEVAEVDTLGAVSQGVVSYAVKITFDTQDERVKSGMSVSAAIITDIKQDVLIAPSSAVKSQGNGYYVEIFDQSVPGSQSNQAFTSAAPPKQQPIEVGISNDTDTEIISGLKEGDRIVTRTITSATSATTTSAPSLFGGQSGGGSGGVRIPRD